MPDQLVVIVQQHGAVALAAILMASCLGLPFPSSLLMMAMGSFIEQEDLEVLPYFLVGLGGAVAGDQIGYMIGRLGSGFIVRRRSRGTTWMSASLAKAAAFQSHWSDLGIFLSRWLFSPLGPWVNLYSGATRYSWIRFSVPAALGELVWVVGYLALGMLFSSSVQALADLLGSLTWFLASATVAALLGWRLVILLRSSSREAKLSE